MFSKSDPRLVLIQEYAPHMLGTYQDIKNYQEALFNKYKKQDNTSEMAAVYDVETKRLNDVLDGYLAIKQHPDYYKGADVRAKNAEQTLKGLANHLLKLVQEINASTFNLARMNMMLHGVPIENQKLHIGDTLDKDWPSDEPTDFDGVLMNSPYSQKWSGDAGFLQDPRFSSYGVLAPKSKADFAFLLHGFYHLKHTGIMAIVLPHGVLFRGNAEQKIRKHLLEEGAIDTIIGLPANIFYNTSIPTTVIILKKNCTTKDVFFIDASKEFDKGKNQNVMTDEHIAKILAAYQDRQDIDKFAHLANFDEIVENDYNLNIPRYVDTFEEEPVIPLPDLADQLADTDKQIAETTAKLESMLTQLVGTNPDAQNELADFLAKW